MIPTEQSQPEKNVESFHTVILFFITNLSVFCKQINYPAQGRGQEMDELVFMEFSLKREVLKQRNVFSKLNFWHLFLHPSSIVLAHARLRWRRCLPYVNTVYVFYGHSYFLVFSTLFLFPGHYCNYFVQALFKASCVAVYPFCSLCQGCCYYPAFDVI